MKYTIKYTAKFKRDYKLVKRRNVRLDLFSAVLAKLADGIALPEANHDYMLTGDFAGYRECHIAPDWLLIYRVEEDILVLTLTRTGSHSDLL